MITEINLLNENRIKFRKWLDTTSRGNKPEYKNHLVDVLEFWLDEKLDDIPVGNLFRFESKDVSEFLQLAKKIYEHPSYTGENGIDWRDRHNAPSAAISNYYKYLGFEGNWKKDIYATDPFEIKKAYIEKKFDREIRKESGDFMPRCVIQKIFFGAPGTGKSFKVNEAVQNQQVFRTTFHPDYDYAQFVGAYKPKKEGEKITYSFVPQVFAKAYAAAWKLYLQRDSRDSIGASPLQNDSGKDIQVYLVIEEINRGNCAQIFGDIFQLLDRDNEGFSQYSIDADCDFTTWLKEDSILKTVWSDYETKVGDGKLKLPPNLNILATMNTSDQSLFPMDSAFKRRFDWEYVPIKYAKDSDCSDDWKADEFKIVIGDSMYMWLDFLKKVNADIYDATQSEDKQMGEFFIKPKSDDLKIAFNEFRSKVLFYLWDSVYKDETERQAVFHFPYGDGDGKINSVTFQSLFGKDAEAIVNKIMENLKVEKVTA